MMQPSSPRLTPSQSPVFAQGKAPAAPAAALPQVKAPVASSSVQPAASRPVWDACAATLRTIFTNFQRFDPVHRADHASYFFLGLNAGALALVAAGIAHPATLLLGAAGTVQLRDPTTADLLNQNRDLFVKLLERSHGGILPPFHAASREERYQRFLLAKIEGPEAVKLLAGDFLRNFMDRNRDLERGLSSITLQQEFVEAKFELAEYCFHAGNRSVAANSYQVAIMNMADLPPSQSTSRTSSLFVRDPEALVQFGWLREYWTALVPLLGTRASSHQKKLERLFVAASHDPELKSWMLQHFRQIVGRPLTDFIHQSPLIPVENSVDTRLPSLDLSRVSDFEVMDLAYTVLLDSLVAGNPLWLVDYLRLLFRMFSQRPGLEAFAQEIATQLEGKAEAAQLTDRDTWAFLATLRQIPELLQAVRSQTLPAWLEQRSQELRRSEHPNTDADRQGAARLWILALQHEEVRGATSWESLEPALENYVRSLILGEGLPVKNFDESCQVKARWIAALNLSVEARDRLLTTLFQTFLAVADQRTHVGIGTPAFEAFADLLAGHSFPMLRRCLLEQSAIVLQQCLKSRNSSMMGFENFNGWILKALA